MSGFCLALTIVFWGGHAWMPKRNPGALWLPCPLRNKSATETPEKQQSAASMVANPDGLNGSLFRLTSFMILLKSGCMVFLGIIIQTKYAT